MRKNHYVFAVEGLTRPTSYEQNEREKLTKQIKLFPKSVT